ncbi:MAG: NAD-dependent epimerase/dehydratase family protein, partial [Planctomycetota bacterium]
ALVTGGAGFVGSHLCERLIAEGWRVTALDDLSAGSDRNLAALRSEPRFNLEVGSAADSALVERLASRVTAVFHLSALVGVRQVMEDTVRTIETNQRTTETVLRAAADRKLRLLLASSSEVYGSSQKTTFSESDCAVIGPSGERRWGYAAGKLLNEFHAFAYHHSHGLPVTVVRIFNAVGPRQSGSSGMVLPTFVGQALRGEPITVYGDGSQRRCFCFVGDVVKCLVALVDCPAAVGGVFNVGADREISMLELARKVKELTASDSPIVSRSYCEVFGEDFADMKRRVPDVSRLRAAIGYTPHTPLEEILRLVIEAERAGHESGCRARS